MPLVRTNNHDRNFSYRYDVPASVLERYDYLDDDESFDGWICYKDNWYHMSDFMAVHNPVHNPNPPEWLQPWDGYSSDSFFSGVIIKVSDDMETYRIGTYIGGE
mgnify:CR=1 FL=1